MIAGDALRNVAAADIVFRDGSNTISGRRPHDARPKRTGRKRSCRPTLPAISRTTLLGQARFADAVSALRSWNDSASDGLSRAACMREIPHFIQFRKHRDDCRALLDQASLARYRTIHFAPIEVDGVRIAIAKIRCTSAWKPTCPLFAIPTRDHEIHDGAPFHFSPGLRLTAIYWICSAH